MTINEKLDLILENIGILGKRIDQLGDRLVQLEDRMVQLEDRMVQLEDRMVQLEDRIVQLEDRMVQSEDRINTLADMIAKNHQLLEEFYVRQKEFNTDLLDRFAIIDGKLEMQGNQIARNASIIKAYYPPGTSPLAEPA